MSCRFDNDFIFVGCAPGENPGTPGTPPSQTPGYNPGTPNSPPIPTDAPVNAGFAGVPVTGRSATWHGPRNPGADRAPPPTRPRPLGPPVISVPGSGSGGEVMQCSLHHVIPPGPGFGGVDKKDCCGPIMIDGRSHMACFTEMIYTDPLP